MQQTLARPARAARRAPAPTVARGRTHPMWFLLPAFAILFVFFFLPTLFNFVYAFTDWSSFKSEIRPAGLDNFAYLLSDGTLFSALRVTVIYAALVALFQNLFGFGLAVLLEKDTWLNRAARLAFLVPVLMSALAVGYVFQALLKPDGSLNDLLSALTGRQVDVAWLGSTTWTLVLAAVIHAWKWMGLSMLIYLAGLKTIPEDVTEAARIDGATPWQAFWAIRFPLLAPAVTFNVATALLGSMNGFDIVQALTGGGPARSTEILNIFIYRTFGQGLFAQATAMSLVLFLMVALLAFPVIRVLRRREEIL
ncbi:multiple sugar transport system permease protein/raffinose/stachyose/melibiose transport system permease protein [Nonomuraea thailandensis]|uniref:Multiple sugar transport system permease protein/raffinose/stachyose/melibiose transport system permease protein n=1 Tax=Nonomuraea thailandensis TaxID=1188745 RepID=A0A9X2GL38_9ACTN|nr:sugar ABC transporter permease [Nonomuraea thailandensis]MCP2360197.1 multiple sugar transport system permease protein/raffinose/stachyose/melibiose transport system permease protein [Nonomuraea thailandensis]